MPALDDRSHTTHKRSAAVYVRISQDRGGAGLGVERQETECRALAKRLGWTVAEVYCDNDLSAYTGRRRPEYERMLNDIEAGKITAVIAWHPDRLHRRSAELERYISVCERHRVENQTVTAGMWDLSTPSGRMTARQLGAVAAYESEHKSERLKSARIQQAKRGGHHGGIRCYGYTKGDSGGEKFSKAPRVIPEEAAEIAAACKAIAGGASLRSIVRDLNARKVPTATGKIGGWTSMRLRQTLMSPRIAGYSAHKGVIVGTAAWPAIVDDATWRTVEAILSNPARRTNHGGAGTGAVKWLGSGTYTCTCGQRTLRVGVASGSKRRAYRCTNPDRSVTHVSRDGRALDAYVERVIVERLRRPGTVEKLLHRDDTADVAALRVEQVQLGERKDKAAAMFADGTIDAVQLATITKQTDKRAAEIAEVLAKAGWRSPLEPLAGGDIAAAWSVLSLMQKRAILDAVAEVHVLPVTPTTRGFDPDGVRVEWKTAP
ncbi:MAG TPA: recombinase family protein [Mycobacterium sp.]|nr:recombinase family protein [Mycobacterium sp.]HTX95091.1 recombinase family protein [Mycobacterium sp.]